MAMNALRQHPLLFAAIALALVLGGVGIRSEEHTSELQSSQISYAVFCLKKKNSECCSGLRDSISAHRTDCVCFSDRVFLRCVLKSRAGDYHWTGADFRNRGQETIHTGNIH